MKNDHLSNSWAIMCPGPSLNEWMNKPEIIIPLSGVLVAVNTAILIEFDFDYWAVGDIEVFTRLADFGDLNNCPGKTKLWVASRWADDLRLRYAKHEILFRLFRAETYPCANWDDLARSMPFGQDLDWRSFTFLTALALAVKKGATRIRVYGADFAGDEYFSGGIRNERTNLTQQRWDCERELFEDVAKACAARGIYVTREALPNAR